MAPFGFNWFTFAAVLVTGATVVTAIIWAIFSRRKGEE
jgi:hypothetical protein